MKNLTITPPSGYEIDKEQSTFENIVFKPLKKALPKTWEELKNIAGYCLNIDIFKYYNFAAEKLFKYYLITLNNK